MPAPASPDLRIPVDDEVTLRLLRPTDAERLYELVDANRAHLARWLPWAEGATLAHERTFLERRQAAYEAGEGFTLGIEVDGELVGSVGIPRFFPLHGWAEIGYWLAEPWTGRGLMTRSVRALTTYLVEEMGMHRVVIRAAEGNAASWAIPERLGFTFESTERESHRVGDGFHDARVYAVLEDAWGDLEAQRAD